MKQIQGREFNQVMIWIMRMFEIDSILKGPFWDEKVRVISSKQIGADIETWQED